MNFNSIFRILGLGDEYAKIYSILLDKGQLRMIEIANLSDLPRTSCYEYIPKLLTLGLINEIIIGKSKFYKVQNPSNLLNALYKLKNDLNFELQMFENEFQNVMNTYSKHEGSKAVIEIDNLESFGDYFDEISKADEILIVLPTNYEDHLNKKISMSIQQLVRKHQNIKIEGLESIKMITNDKILTLSIKTGVGIIYFDRNLINSEKIIFERIYENARK
jgi:sugar-specific transcriptional regulator TrmB